MQKKKSQFYQGNYQISEEETYSQAERILRHLRQNPEVNASLNDPLNKIDKSLKRSEEQEEANEYSYPHKRVHYQHRKGEFMFFDCLIQNQVLYYRFNEVEILRLANLLFDEEDFNVWMSPHHVKVDPVSALAVVSFILAKPTSFSSLCDKAGHSED